MAPSTIPALFEHYKPLADNPNHVVCVAVSKYSRRDWRYPEFSASLQAVRHVLHVGGLRQGDHLLVCAPNSPQYLLLYLAAAYSGIVLVPIDFNSTDEFIAEVIKRTKPKLYARSLAKPSLDLKELPEQVIEDLEYSCQAFYGRSPLAVNVKPNQELEIVFTSGSTGNPKGVVLTQQNVASNVHNLLTGWPRLQPERFLSVIPMSHMFEQTVGSLAPLAIGNTIVYPPSIRPSVLQRTMQQEKITAIVGVPAILQLLEHKIRQTAAEKDQLTRLERGLSLADRLPVRFRRWLFADIHRPLGGQLHMVMVGGAPLPPSVERFWERLGVYVLPGYGLTETSPVATFSLPAAKRTGSVGRSLAGQTITIGDGGEILLAGPHIAKGYYQDEVNTSKAFYDGYYHTGDIGELDEDGYLFIKGRQKNMILTSSGLNVYPEDIETKILGQSAVRDCVVFGLEAGETVTITAVILPHPNTKVDTGVIITQVNQSLGSHQQIQRIEVWQDDDFPRTPTKKIKRAEVINSYAGTSRSPINHPTSPLVSQDPLLRILAHIAQSSQPLNENTHLVNDLGLDSIKRLELVSQIEDTLDVNLEEAAINATTTVAGLRQLIAQAVPAAAQSLAAAQQNVLKKLGRALFQPVLLAFVGRFQHLSIHGLGKLPAGPVLFAANHSSHFDAPTVLRALPKPLRRHVYVGAAKDYFFSNWLKRLGVTILLNAIPIDRDGSVQESLALVGSIIGRGESVLIFPEGTRNQAPNTVPFKPGIGLLALQLSVPVVPVKIVGNRQLLPKGKHWPTRGRATIRFGAPRRFSVADSPAAVAKQIQQAVDDL